MDNRNKNMTPGNTVISWGIAALAGFIAFLLFLIVGDQSWSAAGFGGGLVAVVLAVIFTIIFGRDLPPLGSVSAPTAKGSAAPRAAPAAPPTSHSPAPSASPEVAAGSAGGGGGGAAATAPAATGTPAGQGADKAAERKQDALAAEAAATKSTKADASTGTGTKPATLDAPRGGSADDLKKIKGVGPKMEKMCNELGFWHFDQIASWTPAEVAWVDENLEGFKGRVSRDEWVGQAKALAAGEDTEFSKKVDKGDVY